MIEIGHLVTDEGRVIFVRDNGVGFDMQYSNKLFRPFERMHNRADIDGTGIGVDHTIFATQDGVVAFGQRRGKRFISVVPAEA